MSDEHEQPEGFQMGGFMVPLPPEIGAAIRAQQDQAHMKQQDLANAIESFFDELPTEKLITMREIIHRCADEGASRFYVGWASAVIHARGVCTGCGKNHLDEMLGEDHLPVKIDDGTEQLTLEFPETEAPVVETPVMSDEPTPAEAAAVMADNLINYSLRFPREGEVNAGPNENPVICTRCGMLYQSIEDRMRRVPSEAGCEGCVSKAKWG